MLRLALLLATIAVATACTRAPRACEVLAADEITRLLQVSGVKKDDTGSGVNSTTGIDTCRWIADGGKTVEVRLYRADASAEGAWKMVFESSKAHATRPDASGRVRARSVDGVGDEAMLLPASGPNAASVAFRAGRTGAVVAATAPDDALVALAKLAAGRM